MATALAGMSSATADRPSAVPVWYRRSYSYVLAALLAAEIVLTSLAVWSFQRAPSADWPVSAMIGMLTGQCVLLGLWAALGGLSTVPRWLLVGLVFACGAAGLQLVTSTAPGWSWSSFDLRALIVDLWQRLALGIWEVFVPGGVLFTGFAALLLPLRRLLGWRVDFDAGYYRNVSGSRGQVGMLEFAAYFCAVALPLMLVRLAGESDEGIGWELLIVLPVAFLLIGVSALPVIWATLAERPLALWLVAAAVWVVAFSSLHWLASLWVVDLNIFDTRPGIFVFHASLAFTVAAPLLALRCAGLRLIRVYQRR